MGSMTIWASCLLFLVCTMSKLSVKHPRDDFETDSDFEDMLKRKARLPFASAPTANMKASKEPIVAKNTEKATAWGLGESLRPGSRNEMAAPLNRLRHLQRIAFALLVMGKLAGSLIRV